MATVATDVCLLLAGSLFYPSLYYVLRKGLQRIWKQRLSVCDIFELSLRCVSSIQALISCVVGVLIITSCQDIMYDQSWLTNNYAKFVVPYFYYDTWAMYRTHWYLYPGVQTMTRGQRVQHFLQSNAMMMVHHVALPLVFFPLVLYFREGKGDFFVGVFYLFEMAVPFIAARFALVQLKLQHTVLYIVVGLMMIAMFFISRVLIFPYLYWSYARYKDIPISHVPYTIPIKCNVSCLGLLLLQFYWLYLMIRGAFRVFYKIYLQRKSS
ncbi:ceramide synthase-like [Haliotis rubra]|uniref:ceramide synthase-like n=1 Tax=Haliotis rubra TaxID=36100 RepID=UPI001EE5B4DE|nr:ceramide synthase-like [Haliotis rubra]